MFDSVRMTFKGVFFPCLRTGIAAPLRDTVFVPVVFYLCSSFYCLNDLDPVADHGKTIVDPDIVAKIFEIGIQYLALLITESMTRYHATIVPKQHGVD